ncbi:MAG TPA: energy transducer TonB [Gemmatimonadaceae bacterium]|nr:energy transducer TonB [Gemmatimonadaceae bacterium]
MFGVLIESRARKQKRTGSAALSVAAHVAIIGAVTATAAHGHLARNELLKPRWVRLAAPVTPPPIIHHAVIDILPRLPHTTGFEMPSIQLPADKFVPAIGTNAALFLASNPPVTGCADCGNVSRLYDGVGGRGSPGGGPQIDEWRGRDLLMRIVSSAIPRYPERLRNAGVEGSVLVQFVVDTTGRIDMSSIKVIASTHDQFTAAVRDALSRFRFRPAEADGRHVPAVAQMPFEFRLK